MSDSVENFVENLIVETARQLIPPDDIINCSPLYTYTLYRLLLDEGIKIASADKEEGISIIMYRFLFPTMLLHSSLATYR